MRLLFLGISPSDLLKKILMTNEFPVEVHKNSKAVKFRSTDLVSVYIKKEKDLTELKTIRKHSPTAWISVIIDKKNLHSTSFQQALLECEEKNVVWTKEDWEIHFWLSLQQVFQVRKLTNQIKELEAQNQQLQKESVDLWKESKRMVARLEKDVDLAQNIQRSILPRFSPDFPGISISAKYVPAAGLGGDYYDLFEFGDKRRCGFLLADSKTHGMAAALLSVLLKVRLEEMKERFPDSKSLVEFLNREIQAVHSKNLASMSLFYGILDRSNLTFQYTSAGDIRPIHWRNGAPMEVPAASNPALGGADNFSFREQTLSLRPGDFLLLHTDGLAAPLGVRKEEAHNKVMEILRTQDKFPSPMAVQNEFLGILDKFTEKNEIPDDLTLIHVSIDERALYIAKS